MRLAYFSPFPPQKSGISDYSEALLPYLTAYYDIDLWTTESRINDSLSEVFPTINYHASKKQLAKLKNYDKIIYNLGNNPEFHAEMYDVFLKFPGYVILHDYVLFFLVTGYFLEYMKDREGYIREFFENYGNKGIHDVKKILRAEIPPLQFPHPEHFPLIKKIIDLSPGIIVHSESSKTILIMNGCNPDKIQKINQLNYSNMNFALSQDKVAITKKRFGISNNSILVTSLGYIAPTKRNEQVIKAVNEICSLPLPIQYLMIGEGNYVDGLLNQYIKKTGFVSRGDYEKLISCSDIVINLRNPSMGETSATLLQAMTARKPCIVSDNSWFSELPENAVIKISTDTAKEIDELKRVLIEIICDNQKRMDLAENAEKYVLQFHNPKVIAEEISRFLNRDFRSNRLMPFYSDIIFRKIQDIFDNEPENALQREYMKNTTLKLKEIGLGHHENPPVSRILLHIRKICGMFR
jgi:glycosyltransferase involved in cell wall biosynthesis